MKDALLQRGVLVGRSALAGLLFIWFAIGCQTPGWQIDANPEEAWHDRHPDVPEAYDAELHAITPALVARIAAGARNGAPPSALTMTLRRPSTGQPAERAYRVGPGDLLSVIVFGHPDLTNPAGTTDSVESSGRLVDADGEIFMPFIGELAVAGRTVDEIRGRIAEGLAPVINNPQVDVRVIRFRSQTVIVMGDLPRPCRVPLRDVPLTLLDALQECESLGLPGGNRTLQDVNAVQLVRDGTAYPIVLSDLYRTGDGPVFLEDGDRIVVDNRINRIFLVGEFAEQAAVAVPAGGLSLADGIAAAGGIDLGTASTSEIFVIRGFVEDEPAPDGGVLTSRRPHIYHLDARSVEALLLADRFPLQARDVVYAAPADLVNFNRALAQLTPSLDVLLRSAILFTR